jgi:hypothetical protein
MKKDLTKKVKQAKNCFAWVMLNDDDGTYICVSKKEVKHLLDTISVDEIDPSKFVLRECGDLYIN